MPLNIDVTVHHAGGDELCDIKLKLARAIHLGETNMATIQEIKTAIAEEAAEVKARVDALEAEVQVLKDQGTANAAELDSVLEGVRGIFTAPVTPPVA